MYSGFPGFDLFSVLLPATILDVPFYWIIVLDPVWTLDYDYFLPHIQFQPVPFIWPAF